MSVAVGHHKPRSPSAWRMRRPPRRLVIFAISFVLLIALWEVSVNAFAIPQFLLPLPSTIGQRLYEGIFGGTLLGHTWVTLQEIAIGYTLGCGLGIGLGILISQFRLAEDIVYPYVVALNSVPKVATAPLIVIWFGYGIESKVVIAALVAFFPLLVNVILGLHSVGSEQLALMRSLTASSWQTFTKVKLPNALPAIFAGLEVAVVLSVVGAIVGEFVGAQAGLGYYIKFALAIVDTGGMFAAFIILAVIGTALNQIVKRVAKRVVFWRDVSGPSGTA